MLLGSQAQPTWPFAVRVSGAAFGDPELRAKLLPALWSIAAGLALGGVVIVVGVVVRRLRWYAVPAGLAIAAASVAAFAPVLSVLAVEAFPTTFYRSPTSYSASSIVRGAELFATHCASCHGKSGRGDGPPLDSFGPSHRTSPPIMSTAIPTATSIGGSSTAFAR